MVRRQKSKASESQLADQRQITAQQNKTPPCPIVGVGASSGGLAHIFDRFLQEEGIGNRSNTGLGLGLTIVRSLVEQHGGTVGVSSQLGEGTTFTINLPLPTSSGEKHLSAPLQSAEPVPPTAISAQFSSLEGVRVLVVEDQVDVQELVKIILEQCGAQVNAVGSVVLALQTLMANPGTYDVLISDIGMPKQDGFALIRQVRLLENAKDRQIPAAALTAYANPEEKRAVLEAGFQVHISKPVDPMQLSEIVASLAGRR
uniref:histidine kinase n=1 Tax=Cyanothece sp. (strain PCC 7425 / ATCC 29141) TaxID=395961 RepID=B8HKK3_CYAP4